MSHSITCSLQTFTTPVRHTAGTWSGGSLAANRPRKIWNFNPFHDWHWVRCLFWRRLNTLCCVYIEHTLVQRLERVFQVGAEFTQYCFLLSQKHVFACFFLLFFAQLPRLERRTHLLGARGVKRASQKPTKKSKQNIEYLFLGRRRPICCWLFL